MLPSLLAAAPSLYDTLSDSYKTNLTLDQALSLAWLAAEIPRENIRSAVIDQEYLLADYTACSGRQLLVPDLFKIGTEIIEPLFLAQLPAAPAPTATLEPVVDLAEPDAPRISVQNGSSIVGVAWETRDYLVDQGFNVVDVGNAERLDYPTTVLIDYTGNARTIRVLAEALRVPPSNIYSGSSPDAGIDVRVIIGADFVLPDS
jgi:hypothetical protein